MEEVNMFMSCLEILHFPLSWAFPTCLHPPPSNFYFLSNVIYYNRNGIMHAEIWCEHYAWQGIATAVSVD